MRTSLLVLVVFFFFCSLVAASVRRPISEPSLQLTATPPRGKAPLTVVLRGTLNNVEPAEATYYCLDAEWDFDPGRSLDTNDCPPFESGQQKVQLNYSILHTFDKPGTYRVRLMLRRGNAILLRMKSGSKSIVRCKAWETGGTYQSEPRCLTSYEPLALTTAEM